MYRAKIIIECIVGFLSGALLGITSIPPTGIVLLLFDYLKISSYKTILGSILFLNLLPISIGSVTRFYETNTIDYSMAFILFFSMLLGGYISSYYITNHTISIKQIKIITAIENFFLFVFFVISAYYETK